MRHIVVQAAHNLIYNAVHDGGDTSGVAAYKRQLLDFKRHFHDDDFKTFEEIGKRVERFRTLRAAYDEAPEGEVESICDDVDVEEDWLLAQYESFSTQKGRKIR